jgi:phytanoyl-CoA hydroxylase
VKPFQQYASEGWHVVRKAIPRDLVDSLVIRFQKDAKNFAGDHLRQNTRVESNNLDSFGFMKTPLLNPHFGKSDKLGGFRDAILDLACSSHLLDALATVTLHPRHVLLQTMMFEQSVTAPHQDWVYLDSYPSGCLTAAWVALEDISPNATRFFIVPGTQDFDFDKEHPHDWTWSSSRYQKAMIEMLQNRYADQITIPEMRAGDVLFWNSRLIHGSLAGTDPSRSRLSLAVHYIPEGYGTGNRQTHLQTAYPFTVVTGRPIPYTPDPDSASDTIAELPAPVQLVDQSPVPPKKTSLIGKILNFSKLTRSS